MVNVGQKVRFDPFDGLKGTDINDFREYVKGTVVMVNERNKWFLVEWGDQLRTSYKFCDIGERVKVLG